MTTTEQITPADEVRAAASKLRNTAAFAATGKWEQAEHGIVRAESTSIVCTANGRSADGSTAKYIALMNPGIAELIADWLDNAGDDMSDEGAYVQDHPEWIGLDEDLRWGVFAYRYGIELDHAPWKTALITARAINAQVTA